MLPTLLPAVGVAASSGSKDRSANCRMPMFRNFWANRFNIGDRRSSRQRISKLFPNRLARPLEGNGKSSEKRGGSRLWGGHVTSHCCLGLIPFLSKSRPFKFFSGTFTLLYFLKTLEIADIATVALSPSLLLLGRTRKLAASTAKTIFLGNP